MITHKLGGVGAQPFKNTKTTSAQVLKNFGTKKLGFRAFPISQIRGKNKSI
jgi:hypothetical protein